MFPIVNGYADEELIRHLEKEHPQDLEMVFTKGHRRFASRRTWDVYHDYWLHRAKPENPGHDHEGYLWTGWERGTVRFLPGWKQMTRCNCLQPPTHQADCTGRQGVVLVGEENNGPSAREAMRKRLDEITDTLMGIEEFSPSAVAILKSEALSIAWCLALLDNPSAPDVKAVRTETMKRWKERNKA